MRETRFATPGAHVHHATAMASRRSTMLAAGLGLAAASAAVVGGCGFVYGIFGYPPEATRETPPPDIDKRAKKAKQQAAPVKALATVPNVDGGQWEMKPGELTVLIFYRGAW